MTYCRYITLSLPKTRVYLKERTIQTFMQVALHVQQAAIPYIPLNPYIPLSPDRLSIPQFFYITFSLASNFSLKLAAIASDSFVKPTIVVGDSFVSADPFVIPFAVIPFTVIPFVIRPSFHPSLRPSLRSSFRSSFHRHSIHHSIHHSVHHSVRQLVRSIGRLRPRLFRGLSFVLFWHWRSHIFSAASLIFSFGSQVSSSAGYPFQWM